MFFKTYWDWLGSQLNTFLVQQLQLLANVMSPAITTSAGVAIMMWGYMMLSGRVDRPLEETIQKLIKIMLILGISLQLWSVNDVLVEVVINGPSQLFSALNGATDPISAVDQAWNSAATVAGRLYDNSDAFSGDVYNIVWSVALYITAGYLCLYVVFLMSLAKIAATIMLALAPIFVACQLFDSTRAYFETWIHELANFVFISLLTGMFQALIMTLVNSYAAQTNQLGANIKTDDSIDLVLTCALSVLLLHQILPIAARLSGGYSLNTANWPERASQWTISTVRHITTSSVAYGASLFEVDGIERE